MSATSSFQGAASRGASRRKRPARRPPAVVTGVRWDRIGRLALLFVLIALIYLYASAGVRMFTTWQQSRHDRAAVAALEREHRRLERQHELLSGPGALEAQARQLGLIRRGEQPYALSGLPGH